MIKNFLLLFISLGIFSCAKNQTEILTPETAALVCENKSTQYPNTIQADNQKLSVESLNINQYVAHQNFIVKFKPSFTKGLAPTGNPISEYRVKGLTMKPLNRNAFIFSVKNSAEEKKIIIQKLISDNDVDYIEPDYKITMDQDVHPTEPYSLADANISQSLEQWSLNKVRASEAWTVTEGSKDIVVAVLDSGIDYTHNDLKNNIWINPSESINGIDDDHNGYIDDMYGWNFPAQNSNPISTINSNHGTHVAGIIGGTGNSIFGLAPNVKLMALKFIGENGTGSTSDAIRGIDYAIDKKVFAINNSWGSTGNSVALSEAIARAEKAGILFVVAAGNGNNGIGFNIDEKKWYPASYNNSNIISVAATNTTDLLAPFSNFGKYLVDVAAPGLSILSTVSNQGYERMSGTSMATPVVTGIAVLIKAANPALTYTEIIRLLENSVDRFESMIDKIASGGRVNAFSAVRQAREMRISSGKLQNDCNSFNNN